MFFIPMTIPEFARSSFFIVTVWTPGGAVIIFAQSWNFELNFFWIFILLQKLALGVCESIFCPKNVSKWQKTKLRRLF